MANLEHRRPIPATVADSRRPDHSCRHRTIIRPTREHRDRVRRRRCDERFPAPRDDSSTRQSRRSYPKDSPSFQGLTRHINAEIGIIDVIGEILSQATRYFCQKRFCSLRCSSSWVADVYSMTPFDPGNEIKRLLLQLGWQTFRVLENELGEIHRSFLPLGRDQECQLLDSDQRIIREFPRRCVAAPPRIDTPPPPRRR